MKVNYLSFLEKASKLGWTLMRNNSGAFQDSRGVWVRFGLGNSSKAANSQIKSSDLIGLRRVTITPDMVGKIIGQFVAVEVKQPNEKPHPAQQKFIDLINQEGGHGLILHHPNQLEGK